MATRNVHEIEREIRQLQGQIAVLLQERVDASRAEAEESSKRVQGALLAMLCDHGLRTHFEAKNGRAYWVCDSCEQVVGAAKAVEVPRIWFGEKQIAGPPEREWAPGLRPARMSDLPANAGEDIAAGSALVIDPETRLLYGEPDYGARILRSEPKPLIRSAGVTVGGKISIATPLGGK